MHEQNSNLSCPVCGKSNFRKAGIENRKGKIVKRYCCRECGKKFDTNTAIRQHKLYNELLNKETIKKIPNVLVLDIETTPMEVYVWGLYKQRISPKNVIEDWNLLSWAGKWLFHNEIHSDVLSPKEAVHRDDRRITKSLYDMVNQADVIIAHNGIRFDIRKMNTRFIMHKFPRPTNYQVIDTLKSSQRVFAFSSNTLDYLGKLMVRKQKMETDFQLWLDCMKGDQESLDYMIKYNIEDVLLLEEVYNEIRGWIPSHPNLSLYAEATDETCPICLSSDIKESGEYITQGGIYDSCRCNKCNALFRRRKNNLSKEQKEITFLPSAR